jgi:hypothetical protein
MPNELANPNAEKKMHAVPAVTSHARRPPSGAFSVTSFSLLSVEGIVSVATSCVASMSDSLEIMLNIYRADVKGIKQVDINTVLWKLY